jgi:hypothetical protein
MQIPCVYIPGPAPAVSVANSTGVRRPTVSCYKWLAEEDLRQLTGSWYFFAMYLLRCEQHKIFVHKKSQLEFLSRKVQGIRPNSRPVFIAEQFLWFLRNFLFL